MKDQEKLVGYRGTKGEPEAILLVNNGLHIDIRFDRKSKIGELDKAGVEDIVLNRL